MVGWHRRLDGHEFEQTPGVGDGQGSQVCCSPWGRREPLKNNSTHQHKDSVQFSCSVVSNSLWPHESQHARLPYPSPTPGVCSNSCPLSWWCHPTISSLVTPILLLLSIFPSIRVFSNELGLYSGQSIGASASVLPVNIQGWFPVRLTGLISLLSRGLSGVFSSTTIRSHQFSGVLPSLWSSSHIHTWPLWRP